ncbi:MAG: hypothetical protein ALECFALPRED_002851 [Alectoria fallacina]|uniref:FAD-binding domain-containing protein n=1 Tax=Alectoria fallacina TaxID=1903189 RepID=A0A8H3IST4_9LECA|nr:MAG: hypothetical protein ALECFALPRED_002851 [Alectoria fallacina]
MSSAKVSPKPFSVAIIGAGIGGLCTAIALLKYPHIDVQVYEAAPTFGEIGAGVGIAPNAQQALELIAPEARAAYDKHATGNMWPKHAKTLADYVVGEGEHEGELIHAQLNASGQQSVHRAHFLDELVKSVPSQRAHFNKRVDSLKDKQGGPVVVHFKDGTTAIADAVIGADGVHSTVRAHLLGKEAAKPVFAGSVAYRALVPMDKAVEKLGEEFAGNAFFLCGRGKASLSYPTDGGHLLNVVLFDFEQETWEHEKWVLPADPEALRRMFSTWGASSRALVELLLATPNPSVWAMWDHPPAPTYTKGRIAMMGDAAHATTPYQGQGAGQAIEDALVLATLLAEVTEPSMVQNAFLAYDQVRRVRTQRVVSTSRDSGQLVGMRAEGVGSDLEKMRQLLSFRVHWIWNRDMVAQNREAVQLFKESL